MKIEIGELIIPVDAKLQNFDVYVNNRYLETFEGDKDIAFSLTKGK